MMRVIIIHGWGEKPTGQWLPWLKGKLEEKNIEVSVPEMPNTENPKLTEWMDTLLSLSPDENTVLIGHSLGNALIMKYLEDKKHLAKSVVLVACWDWLMENLREYHQTFFEKGFDYQKIKERNIPTTIINSTNDPYIDLEKAKPLKDKIGANFIEVENAGHFMARDGYSSFDLLLNLLTS